jgi:hypothetical protein
MRIHPALLAVSVASIAMGACSSSSSQDSGLTAPTTDAGSTAAAELNPYGVAYPTANLGYLARRGSVPGNVIENYKFLGHQAAADSGSVLDITKPLTTVALADYFDPQQKLGPAGTGIKVIHLSVAAYWCVPCNNETDDTVAVAAGLTAKGVVFVQALDDGPAEGTPATPTDLGNWITKHKSNFTEMLDPGLANLGQFFDAAAVPFNANIDARTMEILSAGVGEPASVTTDVQQWLNWVAANPVPAQ